MKTDHYAQLAKIGLHIENGETQREFAERCRQYLIDNGYLRGNKIVIPKQKGSVGLDEKEYSRDL